MPALRPAAVEHLVGDDNRARRDPPLPTNVTLDIARNTSRHFASDEQKICHPGYASGQRIEGDFSWMKAITGF